MFAFSLPFCFVLLFSITSAQSYIPTDHLLLNCGSSATAYSSSDQRYWDGDKHSKFVPSNINTTSFSSTFYETSVSVPLIPYATARVFNTSFTYTIPVSQGPKFLRLHFYPGDDDDLNSQKSFFSVTANEYILLSNFSPFLAASFLAKTRSDAGLDGSQVPHFVKEFLIYVNDRQILDVTFTPSHNSFAFINGIEIFSMPEDMYFSSTTQTYVGLVNGPIIDKDTALENIYRLNVGGRQLSCIDDSGMCRSWDNDGIYIFGAAIWLTPVTFKPITYTMETPNYTAPEDIYQSQRSMGPQSYLYNLTWLLPVDSGFYYMLRLHFCNIIPQYNKSGQVVFSIFINNQTADDEVDLLHITQGSGYPVFKDYIVLVNDTDGSRGKQDLWLAMHPRNNSEQYQDAYLNGLEAFKLSMNKSLASPNPELVSITTSTGNTQPVKGNKKETPYALIIGGIGGGLVLFAILVFVVLRQQRLVKLSGTEDDRSPARCRRFSLEEMKAATGEFNENFVIGNGGFGKVYKGCIDNATTTVAIKRLDSSSGQGFREFRTEIEMLSKLRHVQLVSLIGYCDDEGEMILVYDYMAQGTLREHLYNTNNPPLSWKRRLDICIGVAKGLHYLHSGGKRATIHGDIKSTNILLDENWIAKLSDFGLSRLGSEDQSDTPVNTVVKGTLGYIDPEYCWTQQLTKKSDVYSFGVVLLEVLCARPVVVAELEDEQASLAEWGKTCYERGILVDIIDPKLSGEIAPECLRKFGDVASKCLHEEGSERPAMEEVVWRLEFALQLQEDAQTMSKNLELTSLDHL